MTSMSTFRMRYTPPSLLSHCVALATAASPQPGRRLLFYRAGSHILPRTRNIFNRPAAADPAQKIRTGRAFLRAFSAAFSRAFRHFLRYSSQRSPYKLRVECVDYAGKTAWTNAIFPRHAAEDSDS
jgi:hypothetical protein